MELELDPDWHGMETDAPNNNRELEKIKSLKGTYNGVSRVMANSRGPLKIVHCLL